MSEECITKIGGRQGGYGRYGKELQQSTRGSQKPTARIGIAGTEIIYADVLVI